jgi:hypothetical protein
LIVSANNVVPIALKALDLPDCLTYPDVYHDANTDFKRDGNFWHEYRREDGTRLFEFREVHRTRDNIDLLNLTERREIPDWKNMKVRLPVCGGTAKISIGIAERWQNLYEVWRD